MTWEWIGPLSLLLLFFVRDIIRFMFSSGFVRGILVFTLIGITWPLLSVGSLLFLYLIKDQVRGLFVDVFGRDSGESISRSVGMAPKEPDYWEVDLKRAGTCPRCGEDSLWINLTNTPACAANTLLCTICEADKFHSSSPALLQTTPEPDSWDLELKPAGICLKCGKDSLLLNLTHTKEFRANTLLCSNCEGLTVSPLQRPAVPTQKVQGTSVSKIQSLPPRPEPKSSVRSPRSSDYDSISSL